MSELRVAGVQLPNVVGDLDGNVRRIIEAMAWAEEQRADVLLLPELCLTGYPLEDLALREEFVAASTEALGRLAAEAGQTATIVGTLDRVPAERSWDTRDRSVAISATLLCDGEIRGAHHKVLLPTYDVFDEARTYAAGKRRDLTWRLGEAVAGVCICEDIWSGDGPPEAQAAAGAQVLLVQNASPFYRGKPGARRALVASVARRTGLPVAYVNCVGGQDELVFDGGSIVVDSRGDLLFAAEQFAPARFCIDIPLAPPRAGSSAARTVHVRPRAPREPLPRPASPSPLDDVEQVREALVLGTRDFARRAGRGSAVLGLSGGIDAGVTAALATRALGPENVLAVAMPAPGSSEAELRDAEELAHNLGVELRVVEVGRHLEAFGASLAPVFGRPTGETRHELLARVRGAVLAAISDELGHLVLATGNKSELSIGSASLYGDMAGGFAPLKDCPKTLIYELAELMNRGEQIIPERVLSRIASTQAASNDLPPYEVLDPIVERYVEKGQGLEEIASAGFGESVVRGVLQLVDDAEFKRRQTPPGVKITARAFGQDLRMPITNAWRPFRAEEAGLVGAETDLALAPPGARSPVAPSAPELQEVG